MPCLGVRPKLPTAFIPPRSSLAGGWLRFRAGNKQISPFPVPPATPSAALGSCFPHRPWGACPLISSLLHKGALSPALLPWHLFHRSTETPVPVPSPSRGPGGVNPPVPVAGPAEFPSSRQKCRVRGAPAVPLPPRVTACIVPRRSRFLEGNPAGFLCCLRNSALLKEEGFGLCFPPPDSWLG